MKRILSIVLTIAFVSVAIPPLGVEARRRGAGQNGSPQPAKKNVAILIFNGVQIIDYAGPYEVFGYNFNVYTVADSPEPITTQMGMKVVPQYTFENHPKADIIVIPGGGRIDPGAPGVGAQLSSPRTIKWLQDAAKEATVVMSVCTGAFILAQAGLLDGMEVTTTAGVIGTLQRKVPSARVVSTKRFADNGRIVTTAGLSSGIDGALHVVSKVMGKGWAQFVARAMEYNWQPDSTYAAATLGDRYLNAVTAFLVFGLKGDFVNYEGGTDHWELAAEVPTKDSPAEMLGRINETLSKGSKWLQQTVKNTDESNTSQWVFTGNQGESWRGLVAVERVRGQANRLAVSLKIKRNS